MIAKLSGILDRVGRDHAVIDVGGVGYLVRCSSRTLANLSGVGAPVSLAVETMVREDAIELYGFAEASERDWFRLLLTVQGVGAKVAMALLSALAPDQLASALASGDKAMLARADGVGPKLANRLASELKERATALGAIVTLPVSGAGVAPAGAAADAVSALINLGYRRGEALGAVERAVKRLGPGARVEALIPAGLRELGA
ncbi:MAG TPA: Holliday junction branch migration protein RuvA [Alphaproteobacteria bacterium]|nr:Holliday junction branch migration protein RuvA [Alphaproteobacteria bacterium]